MRTISTYNSRVIAKMYCWEQKNQGRGKYVQFASIYLRKDYRYRYLDVFILKTNNRDSLRPLPSLLTLAWTAYVQIACSSAALCVSFWPFWAVVIVSPIGIWVLWILHTDIQMHFSFRMSMDTPTTTSDFTGWWWLTSCLECSQLEQRNILIYQWLCYSAEF